MEVQFASSVQREKLAPEFKNLRHWGCGTEPYR